MSVGARYEDLAAANSNALEELADRILAVTPDVCVDVGPEVVSVPVRLTVPAEAPTTTVIGHVALTRCTILLAGTRGDGLRQGRDLSGALAAAVCDAEADRCGPLAGEVTALCAASRAQRRADAAARHALVRQTRLSGPGEQQDKGEQV